MPTDVLFGDLPSDDVTVDSATQLTVVTPASDLTGPVDVTVTTSAGSSEPTDDSIYEYDEDPAVAAVTGLTPATGPAAGGTTVVIDGTGFVDVIDVLFGGVACDPLLTTVDSTTQITCVSPPGSGDVEVTVSTAGGDSAATPPDSTFTYTSPPALPTVTAVSPRRGSTSGGYLATITGTALDDISVVRFGTVEADPTTIMLIDSTHISVIVPPTTDVGTVDVRVRNPTGVSIVGALDFFTYASAPPVVHLLALELADGTVITDFSSPITVNQLGDISFAYSGSDDVDTTLPINGITRQSGPTVAGGVPALGIYGSAFSPSLLGDGFHDVVAFAEDSEGNRGFSPEVAHLVISIGTGGGNSTASNPDFEHLKPVPAITKQIHAVLDQFHAPAEVRTALLELVSNVDGNNKHLEDWLNRNTLRRIWEVEQFGDDTLHNDTGWIVVAPLVQVQVQKANPRSKLVVSIDATGRVAGGVEDFVDFGVRVEGTGYNHDLRVARGLIVASPAPLHVHSNKAVAGDAPKGTYLVTLIWRGQNSGVFWRSLENGPLAMKITEAPPS